MNDATKPSLVLCELADASADGVESYSPFCVKVHRALRLADLAYERRHGSRPDAFKEYNPTGQVPVLLVDGEPVCDSTRIVQRVDALTGVFSRGLDARTRAEAWLWEEYADTALNGFVVASRWADDRNWSAVRAAYFDAAPWPVRALIVPRIRQRVIGGLVARDVWRAGPAACWERLGRTLDQLEARAPAKGFWLGNAPSVADVAIFGQLQSLRTALTPTQARWVAERGALASYLDRVDAITVGGASARGAAPRVPDRGAASLAVAN